MEPAIVKMGGKLCWDSFGRETKLYYKLQHFIVSFNYYSFQRPSVYITLWPVVVCCASKIMGIWHFHVQKDHNVNDRVTLLLHPVVLVGDMVGAAGSFLVDDELRAEPFKAPVYYTTQFCCAIRG